MYLLLSHRDGSTTRLAIEVERALLSDPLYGPKHDRQRNTIGVEYEVVLEDMLRSMGKEVHAKWGQLYGGKWSILILSCVSQL